MYDHINIYPNMHYKDWNFIHEQACTSVQLSITSTGHPMTIICVYLVMMSYFMLVTLEVGSIPYT